ncbi:MAG: hypothetical protein AABX70_08435 [Nanoarchaeota archaeon]
MAMNSAYRSSAQIFEQVSIRQNPGMLEQLRAIKDGEIVVVKGQYDHVEKLLDTLKVPYALIDSEAVTKNNGGRVMFANCKAYDTGAPVTAVRDFVSEGGRLVSTDWSLGLVTKAFPKKLHKVNQTTGSGNNDVVEVEAHTDIGRRFMGLNYAQCHPQWWLEGSSHVYDIEQGVVPLIMSEEMEERYGKPYIAVGFPEGKGEVFHFISHLELQRTRLKSKTDEGTLDDFLAKMKVSKTAEMEEAKVAELEAAYSTLNTLAHLCIPTPILNSGGKSVLVKPGTSTGSAKSSRLA